MSDLLGGNKSFQGALEVSNWLGVLDLLKLLLNIGGLLEDLLLSLAGDSDLEGVDGILEFFKLGGGDDSEEKGSGEEFHF